MSNLSYQLIGGGPPLLLLHGFGISYNIWQALVPLLKNEFRLILVELPGIGASPPIPPGLPYYTTCADMLDELRRELAIDVWSILCYSMGTRVGEAYVRGYRSAVDRCILLCPLCIPGWRWRLLRLILRIDGILPRFGQWALSGPRLYSLVTSLGFNGRIGPHASAWAREIGAQSIAVLKQSLRDIPDDGHDLSMFDVRTRFIWGRQDFVSVCPRQPGDSHFRINANHAAPLLAASDIANLTIDFLKK